MNVELLNAKMDKFFRETSAEEMVTAFEGMGYVFIDSSCYNGISFLQLPQCEINVEGPPPSFLQRFSKLFTGNNKKMTSNFSGSFFLRKIAL